MFKQTWQLCWKVDKYNQNFLNVMSVFCFIVKQHYLKNSTHIYTYKAKFQKLKYKRNIFQIWRAASSSNKSKLNITSQRTSNSQKYLTIVPMDIYILPDHLKYIQWLNIVKQIHSINVNMQAKKTNNSQ